MSPLPGRPPCRAGSLAAVLIIFALTLSACSPENASDPLAPGLPLATAEPGGGMALRSGEQMALPLRGTLEATETHNLSANGVLVDAVGAGTSTQLGRFILEYHLEADFSGAAETSARLTAANGDILTMAGSGQGTFSEDFLTLTVIETATITGGTGRFAGATGGFSLTRAVDLTQGEPYASSGSFSGSITLAH